MKLQFGAAIEVDLFCFFFCSRQLKNSADKEQIFKKLVFVGCERNKNMVHIIAQDFIINLKF